MGMMPDDAVWLFEGLNGSVWFDNNKRDYWPDDDQLAQGVRFVDYCRDDFSTHFDDVGGRWLPKSRTGEYSEARLRLNSDHLVEIRGLVAQLLTILGEPSVDWNRPMKAQITSLRRVISDPSR
jgi:hypothetical protein